MSADDFIELVKSYTKRRVDKKLADIDIWTKSCIAIMKVLK